MMTEKIVVSDTNIFIDLVKLDLLGDFFSLPWDIHTTDFVISELKIPEQKAAVTAFIKRKKLTIGKLDAEEVGLIVERSDETGGKISITDGILFLFDELVRHCIIPPELAADTLKKLKGINTRLPLDEVDSRIKKWETIK